ncbi:putative TetR family transcriptional regulator [Nocardia brasiliensis NBRC 14402]|uniref:TetR family transcriptional regulator n=1 Tax=Nocardia brasiliensis (strain ATCC 700358 / HUJEG-1) TaxID=1133849 RepID=K0F753_NOCB7|nr:TetR/AcrR family transcriptional regulator [Nocardia brasiliensis]AFU05539.1 TetR family transcriptional regulator [Nocardia brasiliensis ATCC 700358]ASF11476.1 TetR/AcrR family transcriptional regulator [Nocardia brasiliensis]OCF86195.1 TetR family transcriptional regulator [Nocardia brasiliensis]SUB09758.1 HTH-type transcriptional repressor KstR2 [Nocardia brasiliensis]GAJ82538.1 putative TetR family transcriptional regulator [Nocardia brasiliensis NBRC 14402]
MTSIDDGTLTRREQLKAQRRQQLLDAGARLIADRGFLGMRLDDLGAAVGISGPAVYRHFPNKEALLVELLVGISQRLLDGGKAVVARTETAADALAGLVDFHLDFALGDADLIRIQDRDLENVPAAARRELRRTQRQYVEIWVTVLRDLHPGLPEETARVQAHAAFGLINSTPHSASTATAARARPILRRMALSALTQDEPG